VTANDPSGHTRASCRSHQLAGHVQEFALLGLNETADGAKRPANQRKH